MDIKAELLKENSRNQWIKIRNYILESPDSFAELIDYFLYGEYRLAQRAANAVNHVVERNTSLIYPYLREIISNLDKNVSDGVKRNTVRMLQLINIPEEYWGEIADKCFAYLDSEREAIAVRAFSMTVLFNIVCKVPELKNELQVMIEDHLPYGSAGFQSRGNLILRKLSKLHC